MFFKCVSACKKCVGLLFLSLLFLVAALCMAVFAGDTTDSSMDSLQTVLNLVGDIIKTSSIASIKMKIVFMIVGMVIYRLLKEILKKMPVKWGINGPSKWWKFLALLFEQSILYYNVKLIGKESAFEKSVIKHKTIDYFQKHNLPVDIKVS